MLTDFKCPNCGGTSFLYKYSTSTLLAGTTTIENGKVEYHDPNWHTSYYTCTNCHHKISVQEKAGTAPVIEDHGEIPITPVQKVDISAKNISTSVVTAKSATISAGETKAADPFTILMARLDRMERKIDEIGKLVQAHHL